MTDVETFRKAIKFARAYAHEGLKRYPFDAILESALAQQNLIDTVMEPDGSLRCLPEGSVTVGMMAAKEVGNEERDFAHALHVVRRHAGSAMNGF